MNEVTIEIENITSQITLPLPETVKQQINDELSYEVKGSRFVPPFCVLYWDHNKCIRKYFKTQEYAGFYISNLNKKGVTSKIYRQEWDGRKRFFSMRTQSFPTGLVSKVENILQSNGYTINYIDNRISPILGKSIVTNGRRNYEEEALSKMLDTSRGIIKAPTGSGKSLMIADYLGYINVPFSLVLIHRRSIAYQLQRTIAERLGVKVGLLGAGVIDVKPITVALIQTIASALDIKYEEELEPDDTVLDKLAIKDYIEKVNCVISDESHHIPASTWYDILKRCKMGFFRMAFSATPYRADGKDIMLEAMTGKKIIDISASRLIKEGWLSKPYITFYKFKHNRQPQNLTYGKLYEKEIVNNECRNSRIVELALQYVEQGKKILIAVSWIKHGEILYNSLVSKLGSKLKFVNGLIDPIEVFNALEALERGELQVVICTTVWGEGINVPGLDVVINCKAEESPVSAFQLLGRALRRTETKNKVDIVDFWDEGCRFFGKHSLSRYNIYRTEPEFEISVI